MKIDVGFSMGKSNTYKLLETKNIFTVSLIVIVLTILSVWLFGLGQHRTFFENSILSISILSAAFFLFITICLYKGVKLKDNLGGIVSHHNHGKSVIDTIPDTSDVHTVDIGLDVGDGIGGIVIGILLWIVTAILLSLIVWIFTNVVIIVVLAFIAMLYWIFFRALRLVFKNSNRSKGDLMESIRTGFIYTILYNFWIYGIFLIIHYLK
jgi:hypothetical protein